MKNREGSKSWAGLKKLNEMDIENMELSHFFQYAIEVRIQTGVMKNRKPFKPKVHMAILRPVSPYGAAVS